VNKQQWLRLWGFNPYPTTAAVREWSTPRFNASAAVTYAEMLQRISELPAAPQPREVAEA